MHWLRPNFPQWVALVWHFGQPPDQGLVSCRPFRSTKCLHLHVPHGTRWGAPPAKIPDSYVQGTTTPWTGMDYSSSGSGRHACQWSCAKQHWWSLSSPAPLKHSPGCCLSSLLVAQCALASLQVVKELRSRLQLLTNASPKASVSQLSDHKLDRNSPKSSSFCGQGQRKSKGWLHSRCMAMATKWYPHYRKTALPEYQIWAKNPGKYMQNCNLNNSILESMPCHWNYESIWEK